ncbi:MAG TPA: hypothetical protein VNW15_00410 [Rhizomicrobium sp.]|nr:hypothetical protein [Rhizomicrobium sp.]
MNSFSATDNQGAQLLSDRILGVLRAQIVKRIFRSGIAGKGLHLRIANQIYQNLVAGRDDEYFPRRQRDDRLDEWGILPHRVDTGCAALEGNMVLRQKIGYLVKRLHGLKFFQNVRVCWPRHANLFDIEYLAFGENIRICRLELGLFLGGGWWNTGRDFCLELLNQQRVICALAQKREVRILVQPLFAGGIRQDGSLNDKIKRLLLLRLLGSSRRRRSRHYAYFGLKLPHGDFMACNGRRNLPGRRLGRAIAGADRENGRE